MSNAERQARWRAKRDAEHAKREAELAELRKATASPPPQPDQEALIATLKARIRDLEAQLARKPKPAQAAPQPRSDDARLAACQKQNRDLHIKVKVLTASFDDRVAQINARARAAEMPRRTRGAVMKCLHPDQRPDYLKPEDKARFDEACRIMNEWLDTSKRS